jgi:hypothetical protein
MLCDFPHKQKKTFLLVKKGDLYGTSGRNSEF